MYYITFEFKSYLWYYLLLFCILVRTREKVLQSVKILPSVFELFKNSEKKSYLEIFCYFSRWKFCITIASEAFRDTNIYAAHITLCCWAKQNFVFFSIFCFCSAMHELKCLLNMCFVYRNTHILFVRVSTHFNKWFNAPLHSSRLWLHTQKALFNF